MRQSNLKLCELFKLSDTMAIPIYLIMVSPDLVVQPSENTIDDVDYIIN